MKGKFNCPHCAAVQTCEMPAWEALGQEQDCDKCGGLYVFEDSEGGPNPLEAVALKTYAEWERERRLH